MLFTFITSVRGDLRAALCLNASTGRKLKDRPPAADDSAAGDVGGGARNDKDSQHRWVARPRPSAEDTIYQFEHREVVVQKIGEHSKQLVEALGNAVPIIITTWQKFPFVSRQLFKLAKPRGERGNGAAVLVPISS